MAAELYTWYEYFLRLSHLVAGIAWIGSSFYFIWLDSHFLPPTKSNNSDSKIKNVDGELFMVHGGFYYKVEKRRIFPGEIPEILHWFKWEATLTWLTGVLLLITLYYLRSASLLIDPRVSDLSPSLAISLSVAIIIASWIIYDFIWNAHWIPNQKISLLLSVISVAGLIYLNFQLFSGRGAFIQTGAVFGTLMVANVWMRILPGQGRMLKTAQAGQIPDYSEGAKSKIRSVHNTYFTFPVLFIMLSNHYSSITHHPWNWLLLVILSISAALFRHAMLANSSRWVFIPATIGVVTLVFLSGPTVNHALVLDTNEEEITLEQVYSIVKNRCTSCHSDHPTDDVFKIAPKGMTFDNPEQVVALADAIYQQVVVAPIMPLGNKTNMTEEERSIIDQWVRQTLKY